MIKKDTMARWIFLVGIIVALITQYPSVNKGAISRINEFIWIIMIAYIIIINSFKADVSEFLIVMAGLLMFGYTISLFLTSLQLISAPMPYLRLTIIPMLIYFSSYYIGSRGNDLKIIVLIYGVFALIMAAQIAAQFITNFSTWQTSQGYMYDGSTHKNSSAQTLGALFLIIMVYWKPKNLPTRILQIVSVAITVMGMLYIQSRGCIVAVIVAFIFSIFVRGDYKKVLLYLLGVVLIIYIASKNEMIMGIARQAFMIDKYSTSGELDMNRFSSGRLNLWSIQIDNFIEHPLIGVGGAYCDNFYICVMATGGLLLGLPFIVLYLIRAKKNISNHFRSVKNGVISEAHQLNAVITVFYLVISFFEGFPPYGPGVSCMMFWMLSGYLDALNDMDCEIDYC